MVHFLRYEASDEEKKWTWERLMYAVGGEIVKKLTSIEGGDSGQVTMRIIKEEVETPNDPNHGIELRITVYL